MANPKYYVAAPIYDASCPSQLADLYSAIFSDAIARHKRMCGFDVACVGGLETHGLNLKEFRPLRDHHAVSMRGNWAEFRKSLDLANIRHSNFAEVSIATHSEAVQALFRRVMRWSRTAIYKAEYRGRYCFHDGIDVSDSQVRCPVCGRAAEMIREERYFFRLSTFRDRLLALYKYHPEFIQPQRSAVEIYQLVQRNLKDISIGRKWLSGDVPWPDEPDFAVCGPYAKLTSYLSALGFGVDGKGSDDFRRFWPVNLHVVTEATLTSYAVDWPAFLMAANLALPRHIFAHGTMGSEEPAGAVQLLPSILLQQMGGDAVRYLLLRELQYGQNASLNPQRLLDLYNEDLGRGLEGLARRILALTVRHSEGKIPNPSVFSLFRHFDPTIELALFDTIADVRSLFDSHNFSDGLGRICSLIGAIDEFLRKSVPLVAGDSDAKERVAGALYDACQSLGWIAMLLHPVLPIASTAIWKSLGQTTPLESQLIDFETPMSCIMAGTPVTELKSLFPKLDSIECALPPAVAQRA